MGIDQTRKASSNNPLLIRDALTFMYGDSILDNIRFCQKNNDTIIKCANTLAKIEPKQCHKTTKSQRELSPEEVDIFREFIHRAMEAAKNNLWKQENDDNP